MNSADFLSKAFHHAQVSYPDIWERWIKVSLRLGSLLPDSLLTANVQREGSLDLLIRSLEDDIVEYGKSGRNDDLLRYNNLVLTTGYWVGGVYEILRLLRARKLTAGQDFERLTKAFEIIRVPLDKHELAGERTLKSPIPMVKIPAIGNEIDHYTYDPVDPKRSFIAPMELTSTGSLKWLVMDVRDGHSGWIERREMSDQFLRLWD